MSLLPNRRARTISCSSSSLCTYSPKCSMARRQGPPRSHENELPRRLFSHQWLEGNFSEVRLYGVLGSSAQLRSSTPARWGSDWLMRPWLSVRPLAAVSTLVGGTTHAAMWTKLGSFLDAPPPCRLVWYECTADTDLGELTDLKVRGCSS
jgi:hypothetical protein